MITRTRTAIAAAVIAVSAFAAAPTYALDFDLDDFAIEFDGGGISIDFDTQMSESAVRHMLHNRGYHDIDFDDTDGRYYKLTAVKHGDDYFIKVDSYTGQIVHRHEI